MTATHWPRSRASLLNSLLADIARGLDAQGTMERYRDDPIAYAHDILGVDWWAKQREIAQSVIDHPKTLVRASHAVGKTFVAGGLVNWHFDAFDPGITLTTAPSSRQVRDLLWKEIRVQRGGRGSLYPKAPRMESSADHFALGFTARDATAFQGSHDARLLIVFDEAVGVDQAFWDAIDGMLTSGDGNRFLAIYNPTDISSPAFLAEQMPDANVIEVPVLEHPNIQQELAGEEPRYPSAVRLSWVTSQFGNPERATPISASEATPEDVEHPPGSGNWYRPGPYIESRLLARWPSIAITSVWSEAAFKAAETTSLTPDGPPEIGCDVARFGDDNTAIHVRAGAVSLHHESHNGWDTMQTAGRIVELARQFGADAGVDGRQVAIKIDDDGIGGGVSDRLIEQRFNVSRIGAGTRAIETENYPNRRSELWFAVADRAMRRELDLSHLDSVTRRNLRQQCLAPTWRQDSQGRRVVEAKEQTKKRIKRSPDDADAMNLAYAPPIERPVFRAHSLGQRR